jgi:hypothetical protein
MQEVLGMAKFKVNHGADSVHFFASFVKRMHALAQIVSHARNQRYRAQHTKRAGT